MPAPLDLTGRRFGQLTVLERAGRARWGRDQAAWRCRCDCGALIVLPQNRLPHRASIQASHVVDACDACRRGPCAVCGRRIPADRSLQATTCSDDCRRNAHRLIWRSYHHRQAASDPDYHTRRHEARKARAAEDPAYAERLRRIDRRAKQRNAAKHRERRRAYQAAYYAARAEEIQAKRRARLDAMTDEQRARWLDRARRYQRAYTRRWRAELRQDPARHQAYLDLMTEYRRQRALRSLLPIAAELTRRTDNG